MTKADSQSYRIKTNICEVMENKQARCKATFVYNLGNSYYIYEGQQIPEKQFNSTFPVELRVISNKGLNPNSRNLFN